MNKGFIMKLYTDKLQNYFEIEDYYGLLRKYKLLYENEGLTAEEPERKIYGLIVELRTARQGQHFKTINVFFEIEEEIIDKILDREIQDLPF